jgi:hypothetical protein
MTYSERIEQIQERVAAYRPELLRRLLKSYGYPMLAVVLVGTLLAPLLLSVLTFIPNSTAMILTFGINLLILVYGWRYMERTTRATALFSLYVRYSSQRRRTETLIDDEASDDDLTDALHATESLAQSFIETARDAGIQPEKVESAG